MSDSDRWWVIALLVVFMVGGLLWLLLARMRRAGPPVAESESHEATAGDLGVVPSHASAPPVSTADVTMSRGSSAAGVAAVEDNELDALGAVAAERTALENLDCDTDVPIVGSELSDTSWTGASSEATAAAEPRATVAEREGAPASIVSAPASGAAAATGTVAVAEVRPGVDGRGHGDTEWVLLTNGGDAAVDLAGWRLADGGENHSYTFPARTLPAGGSVRIHMARGDDTVADLYVGHNQHWWNNKGDCAYLYDSSGTLVHVHCYGDATASA